ncbi:MAG: cadherin domain-containing protein [Planctomycetota bacterium]|nr:cadherin domain-containing protein [Planctomycetota bacterium]
MWGEQSRRIVARPMLEALEPRVLLDGASPEQAVQLFSVSPALFVENQGQWADEVPLAGTGGAASEASPQWPATAPGDDIPVEVLSQWGGAVANAVVVGDYAYVCRGLALDILDIRDPSQPVAAVASLVSILGSADPLFADSVYWTGSGDTPNWSDVANWNTGAVPQPADSVIFDGTSVKESHIDAGFEGTIASITINGYAGRISQERSLTITGDYSQSSGQFVSPPNFPFSVGNSFSVSAPGAGMFGRFTGNGDVNNPFLIYDVYGLQCLRDGAALYYKLNNNIDASVTINWRQGTGREGFSPIGGTTDSMFYHSVDGDGRTISNLFINITDLSQTNVGLFGYNMNTITNLGMVNCSITGPSYIAGADNYTGSIAGWNKGIISNCYNTGSVSSASYSGGLAGRNQGTISNCYNIGNISGYRVGGLAGRTYSSSNISNCYNSGNISGSGVAGGLVGSDNYGPISDCYNTGNIFANFNMAGAGGLVGSFNYGPISNSYNAGSVSAGGPGEGMNNGGFAAGLTVWNYNIISNCYNTGSVSQVGTVVNNGLAGGLVGWQQQGAIKNSYNAGKVSSDYQVGGLVGYSYLGNIYNSYNIGVVSTILRSNSPISGFVQKYYVRHDGFIGTISNCGVWMGATQPPHLYGFVTYNEADRNAFTDPSHGVYTNTALNTFNPWDFSAVWDMYDGSSFPFFRWQASFAPTDITLSGTSVAENQPVGTVVGVLSGTDPDPGHSETLVFTLEPGYGDNAQFSIDPATKQLKTAAVFDYETKNNYDIKVRATDAGSPALTYDEVFAITVSMVTSEQWTGGADDGWDNPANWALGFVPGPDTVSVFDGTVTRQPVLGQNQTVKGIDIRSAGWTIGVNGYTLAVGAGGILLPGGTSPTAALDLGDGFLAVNYDTTSPIGDVAAWIVAGYNGGNWSGLGITSALLAGGSTTNGIGYAENGESAVWFDSGTPFGDYAGADSTTVLVRYTLIGDVNLDGIVDDSDISILSNNYGFTDQSWANGDVYDYDGIVSDDDVGLQANNYGMTAGQLTGGISELAAGQASAASASSALVSLLLASGGVEALVAGQPAAAETEPVPDVLREAAVLAVRPLNADGLAAATDGVLRLSGARSLSLSN